ncbi:MAG TPA: carboxypeptidase regulatory-like domain-containing protein [Pyrinomonadaceae bacterium]|nr:carboxypeptidase regulatory-like domain-containing protein [Pyrinomonadaceae bacterium]
MKNKTSTLNRLFSKSFSFVLLALVSLAPAINPVVANSGAGELNAAYPLMLLPPITVTQTNATPINIVDNPGTTVPYPSQITIAGATGTITNVTVTFNNLSITRPRDLDILLVGPGGQAFIVMSDVAGSTDTADSNNVTITLADGSPALPSDAVGTTMLVSGTFRPTNNGNGEGTLPAPAPAGPYNNPPNAPGGTACTGCVSTFASVYAQPGVQANGVWSLYVDDDGTGGLVGPNEMAGGWTLSVTTDGVPTTAAGVNVGGRVVNGEGRGIANVKIGMLDPQGQVRYALSNPFGYYSFADVPAGETYVFSVKAKGYQPMSLSREVTEDVADLEIVLQPE